MSYLGFYRIDDTCVFTVNTHDAATGALADADSPPTWRLYEDETGTPILTGTMAKLDDDNTLGFYSEQVALSAANGFEVGKSYTIRVLATVDSVAGAMAFHFQVPEIASEASIIAAMFAEDSGETYASAVAGSVVKEIADNAGGSSLTEEGIADAVWDEARAGHTSDGSFGQGVASVQGNITGSVASVSGAVGSVSGAVGSVGTGGITSASLASGALEAIQDGLATAGDVGAIGTLIGTPAVDLATDIGAVGTAVGALNDLDAEGVWAHEIEASMSAAEVLRIVAAAVAGVLSGAGTATITIKGLDETTDRIVMTVDSGNRSDPTYDGSEAE